MGIPLSHISPGMTARIESLDNDARMAGRLRDLGFVAGAEVTCVLKKARGNIAAYLVRGAVIALREEDSRLMLVRPCAPAKPQPNSASRDPDFQFPKTFAADPEEIL